MHRMASRRSMARRPWPSRALLPVHTLECATCKGIATTAARPNKYIKVILRILTA